MAQLWLWFIFTLLVGACVGSFLNVVIYRLPAGQSLISPPSTCPKCGHRLAWYDNVPVLGWLWLRGRCRYCANPISVQYPIIEAVTALMIGGWFYICYFTMLRPDFAGPGLIPTWVIFAVYAALLAGLLAATLIDARHYIIPLQIPWTLTLLALVLIPAGVGLWPWSVHQVELPSAVEHGMLLLPKERLSQVDEPYRYAAPVLVAAKHDLPGPVRVSAAPLVGAVTATRGVFAVIGLIIANLLLRFGILPRSFDDEPQAHEQAAAGGGKEPGGEADAPDAADDPHAWLAHPHPRREVMKECLFLALPVIGWLLGGWIPIFAGSGGAGGASGGSGGLVYQAIGGVLVGYLAGGLTVWAIRILGTLGFGKEAMGLGDVHLMAAVGAVCGWPVAVLAFFVAPFIGLLWVAASAGLSVLMRWELRPIPYGPHLAAATVIVMIFHEPLLAYFGMLWMGG